MNRILDRGYKICQNYFYPMAKDAAAASFARRHACPFTTLLADLKIGFVKKGKVLPYNVGRMLRDSVSVTD